ncbi:LOW QUALITY PROTEIN: UBN2 domain-containing protein, partial [Cephalotus follicularis]
IISSLKNLGKSYPNQELVRKILRCLLKSWTPKVTTIEEAKDVTTLPLEQLLGSLMTHETTMMNHESEEIKKKTVALKVSKEENEDVSDKDGVMDLITTQFKKFLKSQKGHYKYECPMLTKKEQFKKNKEQSKKKKAMIATWSDSDYSSSDEESDGEEANITSMAIENEEEDEVQFSFDELQTAYEKLFYEFSVCLNNRTLKKNVISLLKEIETLKNENSNYKNETEILNVSLILSNDFKEENEKIKREVDYLQKSFSTFSNSSDKLDKLLGLQRCVFDKAGLGYNEMKIVKHFKNFFVKRN